MNKAFYIVGIVLSVIFIFLTAYYGAEVSSARYFSYFNDSYSYGGIYNDSPAQLTTEASLWSLLFFLVFLTITLLGLIKIKTVTNKVLSIIGLSITGIFLLWNLAVMSSPGSLSFDEVSPAWVLYALIILSFSIVGLVQSVRFTRKRIPVGPVTNRTGDLLDN